MADFVVGSRTFATRYDTVGPGGEMHAVRGEDVTEERMRAQAVCGVVVLAFQNTSWPPGQWSAGDHNCPSCRAVVLGGQR